MNDLPLIESDVDLPGGKTELRCRVVSPATAPTAKLLIVHGYGEHSGRYLHFMRWMAGQGVLCQAIDLRGHGRSSGRRGFIRQWNEYLLDMRAFLDWSHGDAGTSPKPPAFILGHSHGGLVTAAAGERGMLAEAGIVGCVLSSPYIATTVPPPASKRALAFAANHIVPWLRVRSNLKPEWLSTDVEMLAADRADELMNRSATPRWFFTMRYAQAQVRNDAAAFSLPVLCLGGEADVIADPAEISRFYDHCTSRDKTLLTYPSHLHELLREVGREKIFGDILRWIKARTPK